MQPEPILTSDGSVCLVPAVAGVALRDLAERVDRSVLADCLRRWLAGGQTVSPFQSYLDEETDGQQVSD